ncbi:MAG: TonB-dependent receptor, partial [Calditrichaeota bacterium]|nr:TonB-dependent receptor [Calditrichota bacterium]
ASLTLQLLPRFTATAGLRGDYFSAQPEARLSPRLALSYQLSQRTTLSGSAGRYHQPLPVVLLVQQAENHDLPLLQATHYVLGISHLLSADTRLSVEAYRKDYRHFPLDPAQP